MAEFPYRIFIIEEDESLKYYLKKFLEECGYKTAQDIKTSEEMLEEVLTRYDLYIVDIDYPRNNRLNFITKVKELNPTSAVITLGNKFKFDSEYYSYKAGADLFHKKPVNFQLLEIQIKTLFRNKAKNSELYLGDLHIDITRRSVRKGDQEIDLTWQEFQFLKMLVTSEHKLFSRDEIINKVFYNRKEVTQNSVDSLICRLRKKLGKYQDEETIETVFKSGYRLNLKYLRNK